MHSSVSERKPLVTDPFGFVVIDKPAGLTSHRCVSRLRRCYGLRCVGHGGTLDLSVTGVLPIALGPATRLLPYLPGDKTYRGIIQLGLRTSSDDLDGDVLEHQPWLQLTSGDLDQLDAFRGPIQQTPPQARWRAAHSRARCRRYGPAGPQRHHPSAAAAALGADSGSWNWRCTALQAPTSAPWPGTSATARRAEDAGTVRRTQALGFDESLAHPRRRRAPPSRALPHRSRPWWLCSICPHGC